MPDNYLNKYPEIAAIIASAKNILNCTEDKIRKKFCDKEMLIIEYINEGSSDKTMDIRLSIANLLCGFDESKKCDIACICLDNPSDNENFTEYCNKTYPYNENKQAWQAPDCYITINHLKNNTYIVSKSPDKQCYFL